jgi:hypothetical protein
LWCIDFPVVGSGVFLGRSSPRLSKEANDASSEGRGYSGDRTAPRYCFGNDTGTGVALPGGLPKLVRKSFRIERREA